MRFLLAVTLAFSAPAFAQTPPPPSPLTPADYAQAEKFMGYNTAPLVYGNAVRPTFLEGDRFWYRVTREPGSEFVLVNPATGAKAPAFDHARLAAELSKATGTTYEPGNLPFQTLDFTPDGKTLNLAIAGKNYQCALALDQGAGTKCSQGGPGPAAGGRGGRGGGRGAFTRSSDAPSPDKKKTAFIRDYNLWVRDLPHLQRNPTNHRRRQRQRLLDR